MGGHKLGATVFSWITWWKTRSEDSYFMLFGADKVCLGTTVRTTGLGR